MAPSYMDRHGLRPRDDDTGSGFRVSGLPERVFHRDIGPGKNYDAEKHDRAIFAATPLP